MNARSQVLEFACEPALVSDIVHCVFDTVLFHRTLGKFSYHAPNVYSVGAVGFEDVDTDTLNMTHVRCSSPHMQRQLYTQLAQFFNEFRATTAAASSAGAATATGGAGDDYDDDDTDCSQFCDNSAADRDCDNIITAATSSRNSSPYHYQQRQRRDSGSICRRSPEVVAQVSLEFFQRRPPVRYWPLPVEQVPWEVWTVRVHAHRRCGDSERRRQQRQRLSCSLSERLTALACSLCRPQFVPLTPARPSELDRVFCTSLPDVQPYLYRVVYQVCDELGGGGVGARGGGSTDGRLLSPAAATTVTGGAKGGRSGGIGGSHSVGKAVRKLIKDTITM